MPPLGKGQDGDVDEFLAKFNAFGYNDLCSLPRLSKDAILSNLKKRFKGEVCAMYDSATSEEEEESEHEDELLVASDSGSEEAHSMSSSWITSEGGSSSPSPPYLPISP